MLTPQEVSTHAFSKAVMGGYNMAMVDEFLDELTDDYTCLLYTSRGGMGMIRVTDNGCGIAPEELPTAFLRHATSKLRTEEDLGLSLIHICRGHGPGGIAALPVRDPEDGPLSHQRPGLLRAGPVYGVGPCLLYTSRCV